MARYEASGLSRRAFAAEAGVGLPIFQYWLYKFRRERERAPRAEAKSLTPAVRLLPVTVKAAPTSGGRLELLLGKTRLRVPVGADPSYVAALAAALRGRGVC